MGRRILFSGIMAMASCIWAGCQEKQVQRPGQVVYLAGADYARTFEAGLDAMRESFAIEKADQQSGEILGRPQVYAGEVPAERFSTGLGQTRSELRRKASLKVVQRPGDCAVEVRVDIERLDTQDYQVYEGILANEDLRMRTPAERRDMAGPDQGNVWTFIRRDHEMEDLLFKRIGEKLGGVEPAGMPHLSEPSQ